MDKLRKRKIGWLLFVVLVAAVIFYQTYLITSYNHNSAIVITGSGIDQKGKGEELSINKIVVDTINPNLQFSYFKGQNLSFGLNTIQLKNIYSKRVFTVELYYLGIFTWTVIDLNSEGIFFSRDYFPPVLE